LARQPGIEDSIADLGGATPFPAVASVTTLRGTATQLAGERGQRILILDGNDPRAGLLPPFDLVIVGSGVAGQTVIRHLASSDLRIGVLESGAELPTAPTDDLKTVETPRYGIKGNSRDRFLGGSANTWGGGCVRLDPIDFEHRPWVANSGWPITAAELEPFYQAAFDDLGIAHDQRALSPRTGLGSVDDKLSSRFLLHTNRMVGFDSGLHQTIEQSDRIEVLLNSNLVAIELNHDETAVDGLRVQTLAGATFTVTASHYVLACGGIENSRLLLMSPTSDGKGVGNSTDNVGRYFMEHPKNVVGSIRPTGRRPDLDRLVPGLADKSRRGGLGLSETMQREHQVLNSHVRFVVEWRWTNNPGVKALVALLGDGSPTVIDDLGDDGDPATDTSTPRRVLAIVANSPQVARFAFHLLVRRLRPNGRHHRPVERIWINNLTDMEPQASNRVRLSSELDALGRPRAVVDYAPSDLDKRTLALLHQTIAEVLPPELGLLESPLVESLDNWQITRDASHHMGGTRMGHDPVTSVVDHQGRVHGLDNLFVAGSSVFPSGGYANPTLTIVALAIRLSEHLMHLMDQARSATRLGTGIGIDGDEHSGQGPGVHHGQALGSPG
jgi:choline dehydrogenase-like flavoprotein